MIDLNPKYLETVQRILAEYVPKCEVRAFGSRLKWTAKDYSDLDLAVVGSEPLSRRQLRRLKKAFEESDVPIRVDVVDWQSLSDWFKKVIEVEYEVIQEAEPIKESGQFGRICGSREMAGETIADFVDIVMGQSPPGTTVSENIGIPLLNGPTEFGSHHPTPVQFTIDARKIANPGDLLFCVRASTGRMNWADQKYAIGRGIAAFRHRWAAELQPFVRAVIEFQLPELLAQATGSTFSSVSASQLAAIPYPHFSEESQHAIAHILSTLDEKIELNRQMNATLEAMAQAMFKSWFVDFDPVRAKMEGRTPAGMDAETAALFPSAFQDSQLGKIPKGWEVTTVGEEFNLTMGQSPPGSTYNEDGNGLPFYQGRKDFGFRYPTRRVYCNAPTRIAKEGDTLVSVRAPVGDINMVGEKCCIGRGVAVIRHKTGSRSYTYYAMQFLKEDFALYEAEGTVFGAINKTGFQTLSQLRPSDGIIEAFERFVYPLDQSIENNENQARILSQIRETLLPKLLSGEIRVGNIDERLG